MKNIITQSMVALLLMLLGGATVNAMETYDFQELCMKLGKGGPWAVNDGGDAGFTIGEGETAATMHYLGNYAADDASWEFNWNNRFAYEYVDGRDKFTMRNKNNSKDKNCGMFSWDYTHKFSIMNLGAGDKVTITIPTGTVTFVSDNVEEGVAIGDNVASGTTYTITSAGRLDIEMAAAALIAKIVIEPYGVETVPVIAVTPKTLKLIPGATSKLTADVSPAAETQWVSSDESVATVAEDGTVTAIAAGTATITNKWESTISDAMASDACEVTVADVDLSAYEVVKSYDFTTMGEVTLTLQEEAAGAIWNAANNKNNNVFFCTNEGLEQIAVQAAVSSNKGWSITADGLFLASGAGRCAAVGGIKAGQVVEFIYTGGSFYTKSDGTDDGIAKTALNEGAGRAIYQADADGMVGFELVKGNAVQQINIYYKPIEITSMAIVGDFLGLEATEEDTNPNWNPANGWAMEQNVENPAVWTLTTRFVAEAKTYEYQATANGNMTDYVVPAGDKANYNFDTEGKYILTFVVNTEENTVELTATKVLPVTFPEDAVVYDFEAAAAAEENPANKNGSAANGQAFYGWEKADKTDSKRQDYKGYEWAEGSVLPEVCQVWRRSDRINGNVKDYGLYCPNNREMAVDGLEAGSKVIIVFDALDANEQELTWAIGDGSSAATEESPAVVRATATIDGIEAVPGETSIASGSEIVVNSVTPAENGTGYIVFQVKKGMYIQQIAVVPSSGATGISTVATAAQKAEVYNLAGQRVTKAQKGLYIVNGKKVVMK